LKEWSTISHQAPPADAGGYRAKIVPKPRRTIFLKSGAALPVTAWNWLIASKPSFTSFYELFASLGRMPGQGHARRDLTKRRVRFFPLYSFVIVYQPDVKPIRIIRIIRIMAVLRGRRKVRRILRERI
jgi:plasmid stabilization system protein ParE